MPPFVCPTFEEIEAKEWASKTVKNILTEVSPVSLESNLYLGYSSTTSKRTTTTEKLTISTDLMIKDMTKEEDEEREPHRSNLRRSFSLLEGSLFSLQNQLSRDTRNSRRAQSTIIPSAAESKYSTRKSAPTTPTASTSTATKRLFSSSKHASDLLRAFENHKRSSKEQKGILAWRNKYTEYVINPPPHLQLKPKPFSKKSMQLSKFIMAELLTTEETYLSHLMTIKNYYMDPLYEAATNTTAAGKASALHHEKPLVNLRDVEIIFAFIPQLIVLSTVLAQKLHECIKDYLEDEEALSEVCIGKIFCELEAYFSIYISYAVNFTRSRKYLDKASSNIVYRQLVQDSLQKKETNRMILADYMIAPIQRITRYGLLLTDLQKHSSTKHPDYPYLDRTRRCLSALAYAMNTIQH